jgi:hypothetical protein
LEVRDVKRLRRLARIEATLPASIIRKCILRSLPAVELEILENEAARGASKEVAA